MPDLKKWPFLDRLKFSPKIEDYRPTFLSWYPLAGSQGIGQSVDWLVTGFGTRGIYAWSSSGGFLGDERPQGVSPGSITQGYWSTTNDGQYGWLLYVRASPRPIRSDYVGLWFQNKSGGPIDSNSLDWTWTDPKGSTFNPWRPYHLEFAGLNRGHARFEFFSAQSTQDSTEASVSAIIDLSQLPADTRDVESWLWHPSGQYLTFCTLVRNDASKSYYRRIHLLDRATGQIAASTEAFVSHEATEYCPNLEAWNPGGRLLALDSKGSRLWDIEANEVRAPTAEEASATWIRRLQALSRGRTFKTAGASPDGRRYLTKTEKGLEVVANDERTVLGPVTDAAWSPYDPRCIATIGGPGESANMVRIWRLQP